MNRNLEKLYGYVMDKVHGRARPLHPHDFEDTWARVQTDYGELWERKKGKQTDSQRMGLEPPDPGE